MLNPRLLGKADNSQKRRKDDETMKESKENGETRITNTTMNETRNDVNDTVDGARNEITETDVKSNDDTMGEEKIDEKKPVEKKSNENDTMDGTKINHKVRRSQTKDKYQSR